MPACSLVRSGHAQSVVPTTGVAIDPVEIPHRFNSSRSAEMWLTAKVLEPLDDAAAGNQPETAIMTAPVEPERRPCQNASLKIQPIPAHRRRESDKCRKHKGISTMGLNTDTLERQLSIATEKLEKRANALNEKGVSDHSKDSAWRNLDANRRSLRKRIIAAEAVLAREAECASRKDAATAE